MNNKMLQRKVAVALLVLLMSLAVLGVAAEAQAGCSFDCDVYYERDLFTGDDKVGVKCSLRCSEGKQRRSRDR